MWSYTYQCTLVEIISNSRLSFRMYVPGVGIFLPYCLNFVVLTLLRSVFVDRGSPTYVHCGSSSLSLLKFILTCKIPNNHSGISTCIPCFYTFLRMTSKILCISDVFKEPHELWMGLVYWLCQWIFSPFTKVPFCMWYIQTSNYTRCKSMSFFAK